MNPSIEFARKTALAYGAVCRPLCQELGLAQTAFDILLFLANNPTYKTARDIVEVLQSDFFDGLMAGIDEPTRAAFFAAMARMEQNLDKILEETK